MSKITIDRALADQVLDALDSDSPDIQLRAAIALRVRLLQLQQAEPELPEQEEKEMTKITIDRDPWVHRSKNMTCATCMWANSKIGSDGEAKLGRCRRHAPTMNGYPVIYMTDWCGDHKLDENKV